MDLDPDDQFARCTLTLKLQDGSFAAQTKNGGILLVSPSGRLVRQCVKCHEGDIVIVRLTPPKFTTGFITTRL